MLAFIASVNKLEHGFLKHIEMYWSLLLIPLAFIVIPYRLKILKEYAYKGLIYGCVLTLVICYANVFYEIIAKKEPISYFLRWRHLNHGFTNIADTHPAYLGYFISISSYMLIFNIVKIKKKLRIGILVLFSAGMFQLASRTALFIYILVWVIYFLKKTVKNRKQFILIIIMFSSISLIFSIFGSSYFKERIFSINSFEKDNRVERLEISYEIFNSYPVFGIGFDKIDEVRVQKYIEQGFIVAAHLKYNAHNQFMEYLSINGALGGILYLTVFIYLIMLSIKQSNYLYAFIFITFFLANMTESMMVRIKGIEFYAIFTTLFLTQLNKEY